MTPRATAYALALGMSVAYRLGRLSGALRVHWRRILLGFATGLYVAFGVSLGLMLLAVAHGDTWSDATLALILDGVLLVGMLGGALVGYATRRREPGERNPWTPQDGC